MRKRTYLRMCSERLRDRIRMARLITHLQGKRAGFRWFLLGGFTPWD